MNLQVFYHNSQKMDYASIHWLFGDMAWLVFVNGGQFEHIKFISAGWCKYRKYSVNDD